MSSWIGFLLRAISSPNRFYIKRRNETMSCINSPKIISMKLIAIFLVSLLSLNSLCQEVDPVDDIWEWHVYLRRGKKDANENSKRNGLYNSKHILLKKRNYPYLVYNSPLSYHSWIKGVYPGFV